MKKIFVFGSNLHGWHDGGAARYAVEHHGAIYGQGVGLQGDSYAIPTMIPLLDIIPYVSDFKKFAKEHPDWEFQVTAIGCGIAGYTPEQIAPMLKNAPENCILPDEFKEVLCVEAC